MLVYHPRDDHPIGQHFRDVLTRSGMQTLLAASAVDTEPEASCTLSVTNPKDETDGKVKLPRLRSMKTSTNGGAL